MSDVSGCELLSCMWLLCLGYHKRSFCIRESARTKEGIRLQYSILWVDESFLFMFVMPWPPSLITGSLRYHNGDGGENVT